MSWNCMVAISVSGIELSQTVVWQELKIRKITATNVIAGIS